ncbi:MAG: TolC family protein, partial [Cyanobacteria bacterium P01_F01_bin.42]
ADGTAILPDVFIAPPDEPFSGFTPSTTLIINSGIQNVIESDLTLFYNILTGGSRSASIRAAKKQLESAQLEVKRFRRQLRLDVANDYYDLQEIRALMRVALSAVTNAEQTLNNTSLREQAGLSTKFEILQADVQLANARQNLNLAQGLQLTAQRQLAETLSLNDDMNLVPTDNVEPVGTWTSSLPTSIVAALNNRFELQQILLSREVQEAQRTIVRSAKRPNLSSFAQLTASASDVEPGSFANPNADNFRGSVGYGVGLQLNITAFDGGEIKAQVREIDETIRILEAQYDDFKNQFRTEVETSFYSLEENEKNIQTSRGALDLAQESLELARLRLQAGIGTQLDVIQAETDLIQAEGNEISAILDYNRALVSIARATAYQLPIAEYEGSSFQSPSGSQN